MTLLRLGAGFLVAAALFGGAAWASGDRDRRSAVVAAAEALVLTLLAALWFGSLGHGGWIWVFGMVGLLASGAERWRSLPGRSPPLALRVRATLATTIRYVVAAGLLAVILD